MAFWKLVNNMTIVYEDYMCGGDTPELPTGLKLTMGIKPCPHHALPEEVTKKNDCPEERTSHCSKLISPHSSLLPVSPRKWMQHAFYGAFM